MVELSRRALHHVRHRFHHRPLVVDGAFLATGWLLFILLCMPMTYMGRSTGLFLYGASLTLPLTLLLVKSTAWFKRLKQHYVAL